jgi:hypothetical protein
MVLDILQGRIVRHAVEQLADLFFGSTHCE